MTVLVVVPFEWYEIKRVHLLFTRHPERSAPDFLLPYPEYRLPTKSEWEKLAYAGLDSIIYPYGIDCTKKYTKKDLNEDSLLFMYFHLTLKNINVLHDSTILLISPSFGYKSLANSWGLYSMHDNVSELVSEKGITKGGSFNSEMEESQISKDFKYEVPNACTGFRCVAEWKLFKVEN